VASAVASSGPAAGFGAAADFGAATGLGGAAELDWESVVGVLRAAGCVFAEDEARLLFEAADTPAELRNMVARRVAGLPLEHIVGWAEFCGLRVVVDPGVFVPRQRTALLVRRAAAALTSGSAAPTLVDLACGTGAVGMAVAARVGNVSLYAVDIEPAAVRCARRNLAPLGGRVYEGDLYAPLPDELRGRVDVLVANVPYVPTEAMGLMPREARVHEPRVTLDGGRDGLDVLRRVAAAAGDWLTPGGHVLMEIGEDQADAAVRALTAAGLDAAVANDDELHAWIVIGQRGR
jgi:release factor glutamine methyltransferase